MSLWNCTNCASLHGPCPGNRCPTCGFAMHWTTITIGGTLSHSEEAMTPTPPVPPKPQSVEDIWSKAERLERELAEWKQAAKFGDDIFGTEHEMRLAAEARTEAAEAARDAETQAKQEALEDVQVANAIIATRDSQLGAETQARQEAERRLVEFRQGGESECDGCDIRQNQITDLRNSRDAEREARQQAERVRDNLREVERGNGQARAELLRQLTASEQSREAALAELRSAKGRISQADADRVEAEQARADMQGALDDAGISDDRGTLRWVFVKDRVEVASGGGSSNRQRLAGLLRQTAYVIDDIQRKREVSEQARKTLRTALVEIRRSRVSDGQDGIVRIHYLVDAALAAVPPRETAR